MTHARLSVVTIGARDFPRMRAFYRALGWTESEAATDDWTAFDTVGARLALYPLALLADEAALPARDDDRRFDGITLAINVAAPGEVDAVYAAFIGAGARALAAPETRDWGGRSAYAADPEGHAWEIAYAPNAVLDERGALVRF